MSIPLSSDSLFDVMLSLDCGLLRGGDQVMGPSVLSPVPVLSVANRQQELLFYSLLPGQPGTVIPSTLSLESQLRFRIFLDTVPETAGSSQVELAHKITPTC